MNQIVLVLCAFVAVSCNAQFPGGPSGLMGEKFKEYLETCKTATGLTDDDIKSFKSNSGMPSDKTWCLMACMMKKNGVMDASNKIDVSTILAHLGGLKDRPEMFTKISEAATPCKTETEAVPANLANECTAVKVFATCVKSKMSASH